MSGRRWTVTACVVAMLAASSLSAQVPGLGTYLYDPSGHVTLAGSHVFRYDAFGRITRSELGTFGTQSYVYDRYGNILKIVRNDVDHRDFTVRPSVDPETNQIDLPYNAVTNDSNRIGVYDAAGNLIQHQGHVYVYDALNVMKETTDAARRLHVYTASDERVMVAQVANETETSSEWTLRDRSNRVLRRVTRSAAGTWSWKEDYIYGGGRLLAADVPGAEGVRHFHLDHLGTPRLITGNGGVRVAEKTYEPFGPKASAATADFEQLEFTSHERDVPTLDYMHARYYAPELGRFLSVDPGKDWDPREPQSWNMYTYVRDNPLNAFDPTGGNIYKTTWRVLKYVGQEGKVVAHIAEKTKNKALKRITAALDSIDTRGGAKRVLIAENAEARDTVTRQLGESGKIRGPEKSGVYPEHVQASDGKYSDVHVQTVDDTKAAGFGKGLLAIVAATSLAAGADQDATAGEIVSAALWDTAKALDPLFVTDAIEHATGLDEYEDTMLPPTP